MYRGKGNWKFFLSESYRWQEFLKKCKTKLRGMQFLQIKVKESSFRFFLQQFKPVRILPDEDEQQDGKGPE
jgi:hypothetical protein